MTEKTEKKEKKLSRLDVLLESSSRGSVKQIADAKSAYESARAKVEKARRAVEAAETAESAAAEALVQVAGRSGVRLSSGEVVHPSCRGERVFYRGTGSSDIV
jgi:uncharacterized protein (DUF2345 family)